MLSVSQTQSVKHRLNKFISIGNLGSGWDTTEANMYNFLSDLILLFTLQQMYSKIIFYYDYKLTGTIFHQLNNMYRQKLLPTAFVHH